MSGERRSELLIISAAGSVVVVVFVVPVVPVVPEAVPVFVPVFDVPVFDVPVFDVPVFDAVPVVPVLVAALPEISCHA